MVSFGDVRRWQAEPLDAAERELKGRSDTLLGLADELARSGAPLGFFGGWTGRAAEAAGVRLDQVRDRMEHTIAAVNAARTALITAADGVTMLRHLVTEAEGLAQAHAFHLDDQGQVVDQGPPPAPPDQMDAVAAERARIRAELLDRVREITAEAEDIDNELADVLGKVLHGGINDGGATTLAAAAQAGAAQGSLHDQLLAKYQVSVDPDGMVDYPNGAMGWLAEQFGLEPQNVTASEARHLDDIGVAGVADAYGIYKTALHDAESVFGENGKQGLTDGHADAFRHAYWNAMLANRFGQDWTSGYTTAHERVDSNAATAEAMDLHNNEVGRRIAAEHPDAGPDELKRYVREAVERGEMVVVNTEGRLVPSDEVDIGETGRATDPPGEGGPDPQAHDRGHSSGGYNYGRDGDNYGTYDS
jgi:hypothetical protein